MAARSYVSATVGDGKTLKQFAELIAARAKYLNESSHDAVAACAIDALRSIRAVTRKANKSSVAKGVSVKLDGALIPSFKAVGGAKKICIRTRGKAEYNGDASVYNASNGAKLSTCGVYRFSDEHGGRVREYLIIAQSGTAALKAAKSIRQRRAMKYSGLARVALTTLMRKTATVNEMLEGDARVTWTAASATKKLERKSGKDYSVRLSDNIDYALGAVKGGQAGVDTAMRKALNKVTATINRKCKDVLFFKPLEVPFPEVRQRK